MEKPRLILLLRADLLRIRRADDSAIILEKVKMCPSLRVIAAAAAAVVVVGNVKVYNTYLPYLPKKAGRDSQQLLERRKKGGDFGSVVEPFPLTGKKT